MIQNIYPATEQIDAATHKQLAYWYRFLRSPESADERDRLENICIRFQAAGGWTPEISKGIGFGEDQPAQPKIFVDKKTVRTLLNDLEEFKYPDHVISVKMLRDAKKEIDMHDHRIDAFRYAALAAGWKRDLSYWQRVRMWFRHRYYRMKACYLVQVRRFFP